jgi:hypothetical protein
VRLLAVYSKPQLPVRPWEPIPDLAQVEVAAENAITIEQRVVPVHGMERLGDSSDPDPEKHVERTDANADALAGQLPGKFAKTQLSDSFVLLRAQSRPRPYTPTLPAA